ncbi:hypothetical protein Cgig2_024152 [Carnegiea gigantea]|uniref:Uncharacterized protein n=1 Tax=Carnegiea gigantea TaxID=171969 RepID=A0A9Q1K9V5_9CARY|nr:hypothetical protein Cgig2_024152 [Carnegiea gigantea]
MAELGLGIPKILTEKLISGVVKEACSFSQIKSLIKTLEETKPIIEAWLLDADATQLTNHAERVAFQQLISTLEKMNTSLDVREARAMRRQTMSRGRPIKKVLLFFSPSSNPIVCFFREAREVKALMEELDRIARKHNLLGNVFRLSFETVNQKQALTFEKRAFTSEVVVGRDRDRDNIIRMLLESSTAQETFSMVCIVGIGGMGKTTLAQYVFSNDRVKSHFDMMIWVYVPQVLIAEDVMQSMVAFATDEAHLQWGMLRLQYDFQRQITDKKILLVLDNVWDHELLSLQWQELRGLIGFCAPGSMVLTTTRSVGVAKTMGIVNRYMLEDLKKEDSWHLFKRIAFTQGQDPRVEAIGREIVQLCPNVPLVIRNIGHHLKGMCDITKWVDFKDKLAHPRSCGQAPNVMGILKLSYDKLDPKLKLCFAYCSLFPKGFVQQWFYRHPELFRFWIALGYVVESQSESQSLLDIARDYFHRLEDQGLLSVYGMHDVIHDLACWVAGPTCKRVYSSQGYEFDEERIRHLSLSLTRDTLLSMDLQCSLLNKTKKQLRSLFVSGNACMNPPKLNLPEFECLRVLSITGAGLIEMPRTISKLITLRHLDLSMNKFTKLPDSLTQLVNLLFLNLSYCVELQELPRGLSKLENLLELDLYECGKLQKLPTDVSKLTNLVSLNLNFCRSLEELARDMSKLVKLRELHLLGCPKLRHMPVGLGNCTGLEKLDLFVAKGPSSSWTIPSDSDGCEVGGLAELNRLNNLKGKLRIRVDGKWSSESEARAANLQGKEKLEGLTVEFVGGSSRDNEMMLEGFQPNANLRCVTIAGYKGERIPSWMHDMDYLSNLERIEIYNWKTQARICLGSFGRLPHLQFLYISKLPDLEYIESTTTATPLFSSLEELILASLPKLKGCFSGGVGATTFPRLNLGLEVVPEEFQGLSSLSSLTILNCNLLKGIPEWIETLASLEQLELDCPQLTSSPEQMVKLSNFDFGRGMGSSWLRGKRRGNGSTSSSNSHSL